MRDETLALAQDCRKLLAAKSRGGGDKPIDVYTPVIGSTIDASVDTNAWAIKLSDGLVKRLRWQNVKGLGIVTLTGRLVANAAEQVAEANGDEINDRKEAVKDEAETAVIKPTTMDIAKSTLVMPTLDVVPINMASATRSVAQPLHVGDLRLADLRKLMLASGYTAEFRGEGTLLINGSVAVRKMGTGRIEVESLEAPPIGAAPSQRGGTFYAVKMKIYEGLAVVAGG
jgi:cleavage and polyadenylation specificity factor subunit 2